MKAVGLDSISLDSTANKDLPAHHVFLRDGGVPGLENVGAALAQLPARGATLIVAPLKIRGGSGAQSRLFAIGWQGRFPLPLSLPTFSPRTATFRWGSLPRGQPRLGRDRRRPRPRRRRPRRYPPRLLSHVTISPLSCSNVYCQWRLCYAQCDVADCYAIYFVEIFFQSQL